MTKWKRTEVTALLEVDGSFLDELEQEGIIVSSEDGCYSDIDMERIRLSRTLIVELGANPAGADIALCLLETIRSQRRQLSETLRWLQAQLDR